MQLREYQEFAIEQIKQKFQQGNKKVLLVECKRSKSACFIDGKDFYVRTNPATDKLEGTKLVEYINNHFQNIN